MLVTVVEQVSEGETGTGAGVEAGFGAGVADISPLLLICFGGAHLSIGEFVQASQGGRVCCTRT